MMKFALLPCFLFRLMFNCACFFVFFCLRFNLNFLHYSKRYDSIVFFFLLLFECILFFSFLFRSILKFEFASLAGELCIPTTKSCNYIFDLNALLNCNCFRLSWIAYTQILTAPIQKKKQGERRMNKIKKKLNSTQIKAKLAESIDAIACPFEVIQR